ncbi:MAG TPA: hypothetical protein PLB52_02910 [Candidatus Moranbacteria bacterium]|nr:hypothetical protein [Candidatus Moranbacteria bacterium]
MDPMKSNLEPIEEKDLDMEGKIKHGEAGFSAAQENVPLQKVEKEFPQEISASEKDSAYNKILTKVQTQTDDQFDMSAVASDAQIGAQKTDAETQIQHLVDLAQQKGVVHAVKVARHMEDNYVLDTFHDRMMADELHDALVAKGMIKEI